MTIRSRAATPATVFLLASFLLLLLSCISVPITKTIALGSFNGVTFGVFGYCISGVGCTSVQLGYNPEQAIISATGSSSPSSKRSLLPRQEPPDDFSLSPSARNALSNILIVHVLAAALTFVTLVLCVIAHIHSPSHSVRFLLAIFIIQILTTILTLLSFLVDLLVFVPHFASGTWLVLAATICNAVATILLCCGRRTLIGRKAMRRRIAENAEMSGQSYYKEEATRENTLRSNDEPRVPEFEASKPRSLDRLPLNPQNAFMAKPGTELSDRSGETTSIASSLPGSYRIGLPSGPSPYGGAGYPPAPRMSRPYGPVPPVRAPSDRRHPLTPPPTAMGAPPPESLGMGIPSSRSNVSSNNMNQPPKSNYEPPLPPPIVIDRPASSVYSDYVPPRSQWAAAAGSRSPTDEYPDSNRYRPERPKIDTYNLGRNDRMVNNPARQTSDIDQVPNVRTSDSGTIIASYYEDVDPRFDDNPEEELEVVTGYRQPPPQHEPPRRRPSRRPDVGDERGLPISPSPLRRNYSYNSNDGQISRGNGSAYGGSNVDDSGPRSPAASTSSQFTSVSQRGVNPRWQPQPPQFIGANSNANDGMYSRRNRPPRNDQMNLLAGNPDFELPVSRSGRRGPGQITSPIDAGGRYPIPRI